LFKTKTQTIIWKSPSLIKEIESTYWSKDMLWPGTETLHNKSKQKCHLIGLSQATGLNSCLVLRQPIYLSLRTLFGPMFMYTEGSGLSKPQLCNIWDIVLWRNCLFIWNSNLSKRYI
jgi:hypothetical protein